MQTIDRKVIQTIGGLLIQTLYVTIRNDYRNCIQTHVAHSDVTGKNVELFTVKCNIAH